MKLIATFGALLCAAVLITGCACCGKPKCSAEKPGCGMKCCTDANATCATCATCSAKK